VLRIDSISWLLVFASSVARAAPAGDSSTPTLDVVREFNRFAGVVAIAEKDAVTRTVSQGVDPDAIFWIASLSKQFAAAAVLMLVEEGAVNLTDPVADHVVGLASSDLGPAGASCTVQLLLSHQCGLPRGAPDPALLGHLDGGHARAALLDRIRRSELQFEPGTDFQYSNLGYDLVGLLIRDVSGRPYEAFLRDRIFTPLGMQDSGVHLGRRPEHARRLALGRLNLIMAHAPTAWVLLLDPMRFGEFGASGNVYSTANDLMRWLRALHGGEVLSDSMYEQMIRPRRGRYGLGVYRTGVQSRELILHNGALLPDGYSSCAGVRLADGQFVVVLSSTPRTDLDPVRLAQGLLEGDPALVHDALKESTGGAPFGSTPLFDLGPVEPSLTWSSTTSPLPRRSSCWPRFGRISSRPGASAASSSDWESSVESGGRDAPRRRKLT